ncbi:hypothetical protein SAMN05216326_12036 [Nitrosomonas marina]|uniref:Sporulation related domain-containing protein n=1 Tax=Nitrosomonas marina TaxID=917 RepID=A0A1I0DI69_9PROT|nr:hypothetical protein [Nitrosomonas marina]SET32092.1 hypothetical protein SAMN05216326_12036 [Nitrosomonas marina]
MKIIFFLLLAANILLIALQVYQPAMQARNNNSNTHAVNSEKIILLPAEVSCIEWGNFSLPEIESAETALQALDLNRPYRVTSATPLTQYRVHTDPFEDQQAADREITKFRNSGISSFRIMEQGIWFNSISFGEFADALSAQELQKKLNLQDITGTIISKYITEQKKFLIFETDTSNNIALQPLIEQFPDSKLTQTTCERL